MNENTEAGSRAGVESNGRSALARARDAVAGQLETLAQKLEHREGSAETQPVSDLQHGTASCLQQWGQGLRRWDVERADVRLREVDARVREQLHEHPARTLLIVAGAGFVLGLLIRRRS